ncbi:MAG: DNA ligase D [Geminicoccaceae bacterium]|jgi:bifunctional non-homologous end joining protein LigD|nr:DNA ligase D [Geminicoccaceae bacterium]
MALDTYRERRDFRKSPEPRGRPGRRRTARKGRAFVVQMHAARRLHYDLRLEMDGVLKSWAVTRGPSLVPGEKRLAVHVEDHPLEYGDFEGTIPAGSYGAGTVIVWDSGSWQPIGDAAKGYAKGHLDFELAGEKLEGRWHLVRMAAKPREKRENWLLIKGDDEHARGADDPDILEERPESTKTGRRLEEVAESAPKKEKRARPAGKRSSRPLGDARQAPFPGFVAPALATLRPEAPRGERWVHEIKLDGYRLQAHVQGGEARLLARSGADWTERFGEAIAAALAALPARDAVIDGEVVVEARNGSSDFAALQQDLSEERTDRFVYYAFDLLYLDGYDLRPGALEDRKARLEHLLDGSPPALRYNDHFDEEGELVLRHACRLSLEGIVSKERQARYASGRSTSWIKSKCRERQELVVAGYVPSSTLPKSVGSLVLACHEGGKLVPAGRVGTGFSRRMAAELYRRLAPLERAKPPFSGSPSAIDAADRRQVRHVEPELVVEVEFQSWTAGGLLRHASFRGIREDKAPGEIVREGEPKRGAGDRAPRAVRLTHPDRLYWPEAGVTKEGLADYYAEVWPWMAAFVVGRPLALLRCPQGATRACFFQKHAWKGQSREILKALDPLDESGDASMVAIDGLDGLIGLIQGGALELHGWQSSLDALEQPDQIVMDLDPGDDVAWDAVIAAAGEVRDRLAEAGLQSFVKTSGGKGLHVTAPLRPKAGWDEVKAFARSIADAMAADHPDRYVATVAKAKRRGRILIDYLRNGRGATAVVPCSTRARAGAPVAMPLGWDELGPAIGPAHFTVLDAAGRLRNLARDPWGEFRKAAATLPPARSPRRRR